MERITDTIGNGDYHITDELGETGNYICIFPKDENQRVLQERDLHEAGITQDVIISKGNLAYMNKKFSFI